MSDSDSIRSANLVEAIAKLGQHRAIALRDNTYFRLPVAMKIAEADLCTYLARNQSSFLFLPDQGPYNTRVILRTTNEVWQHDRLPTLAICPTERSAKELQKTTHIESISAVPKRYVGGDDWQPVTTVMEPVHSQERTPALIEVFPEPEPVSHRFAALSRKF